MLTFKAQSVSNIDPNSVVIRGKEPMKIKSQMTTKMSAGTLRVYQAAEVSLTIETTETDRQTSRSPLSASSCERQTDYCRLPTLPEQ
jgi:hypothetical protein